jgi:hypothetical protein
MNRPGKPSMYVGTAQQHKGKVVLVLCDATNSHTVKRLALPGQWWEIDPPLPIEGNAGQLARDDVLRPLDGDEGIDEVIRRVGVPRGVAA